MCIRIRFGGGGGCAANYVWSIECVEREGLVVVGRSVGHAIFCHFPSSAVVVPRSPVEIAMILSSGIIGIHLQDEAGERGKSALPRMLYRDAPHVLT